METSILVALLVLAFWGFSVLRQEIKTVRYKTILIVNVDSLEKDEYDLPKQRIQMRKTVFLSTPLAPGMRVEELGLDTPLKVLEAIVTEDTIAAHLEPIRVSISAVENETIGLGKFDWKVFG